MIVRKSNRRNSLILKLTEALLDLPSWFGKDFNHRKFYTTIGYLAVANSMAYLTRLFKKP